MTGWRIGFVVGNEKIIQGLGKVKTHIDSGVFQAIQGAGIRALKEGKPDPSILEAYRRRRELLREGLENLGLQVYPSPATFYLWVKIPPSYTSEEFTLLLLKETGVLVTPGRGFGEMGEGYIRVALTQPEDKIREILSRWENLKI